MTGEKDISVLLKRMEPTVSTQTYVFCSIREDDWSRFSDAKPLMVFRESEGMTVVLTSEEAGARGLPTVDRWALITCKIHSDLNAVGFLARITNALADEGIPANTVSAYFHDHIFVPVAMIDKAVAALRSMGSSQVQ